MENLTTKLGYAKLSSKSFESSFLWKKYSNRLMFMKIIWDRGIITECKLDLVSLISNHNYIWTHCNNTMKGVTLNESAIMLQYIRTLRREKCITKLSYAA